MNTSFAFWNLVLAYRCWCAILYVRVLYFTIFLFHRPGRKVGLRFGALSTRFIIYLYKITNCVIPGLFDVMLFIMLVGIKNRIFSLGGYKICI